MVTISIEVFNFTFIKLLEKIGLHCFRLKITQKEEKNLLKNLSNNWTL